MNCGFSTRSNTDMDATATQNPHSSSATAANRQTTSSPAARDLILTASNFIKNKRKNFSPRCSSTPEDDNGTIHHHHDQQQQHHHHLQQHQAADLSSKSISTRSSSSLSSSSPSPLVSASSSTAATTISDLSSHHHPPSEDNHPFIMRNQPSDLEAMSMHWRQLIANRCQTNPINTTATIPVIDSLESNNSCLDTNQLYKIPNTNFTITKSQLSNKAAQYQAATTYPSSTIAGGGSSSVVKSSLSTTTISPDYNTPNKVEFAYNAFTAVQELLNVYGLSISPGDIVEAFKKQNVGSALQPPTPPRSPASSAAATITAITSLSSSSPSSSTSILTPKTTTTSSITGSKITSATITQATITPATAATCTSATAAIGPHSNGIIGDVDDNNFSDDNNDLKRSLEESSLDLRTIQSNNDIKIERDDDCGGNDNYDDDDDADEDDEDDNNEEQTSRTVATSTPISSNPATASTNIIINNNNSNNNNNNTIPTISKISTTSSSVVANPSPPLITLAPVSKLMAIVPSQNYQQRAQKIIDLQHQHHQHHQQQQHQHKQSYKHNFNNDCDDTLLDDDDDNDDQQQQNQHDRHDHLHHNQHQQQQHNQQHHHHHQFMNSMRISGGGSSICGGGGGNTGDTSSDQGNSPRPFDLVKINEDSNNSTIDQQHSDDHGSDDFGSNSTNQMDLDTSSRLSVRNVENLLDKCSLGLFSPILQLAQIQNEDKHIHANNIKNLTKFSSYLECKNDQCQIENLREHYHCYDLPCFGKVLSKKEEIIRHLKWHKKRNESLNHGFLRFSASDDCSTTFGPNCTHNRKQTHYHCFQPNCDKVYISTSDVQMHSNYHRKDTAIFQEGFQRYRATEECKADYCMFSRQRTTHFHCRRDNCRFTFKNKADMEKHKSYHIKDSQLARDGFKKFLKSEVCPYERCRFSRSSNHIHCVRENCHYVLHSSGQLLSHKRKHERMDSEQAYRRFKMIQKAALFGQDLSQFGRNIDIGSSKPSTSSTSSSAAISPDLQMAAAAAHAVALPNSLRSSSTDLNVGGQYHHHSVTSSADDSPVKTNQTPVDLSFLYGQGLPIDFLEQIHQRQQQINQSPLIDAINQRDQSPKTSPQPHQPTDSNVLMSIMTNSNLNPDNNASSIDDLGHIIQQCFTDNCTRQTSSSLLDQQNTQNQQHQTEPLNLNLKNSDFKDDTSSTNGNASSSTAATAAAPPAPAIDRIECFLSTAEPHMHCLIKDCEAVIPRILSDLSDHIRMHELNRNAERIMHNSNLQQITSIEGYFNRKRGRPPKNRVVEVYTNTQQSPQAIFTSFKLEKFTSQSMRSAATSATPVSQSTNNIPTSSDHDHHRQSPDNIDSKGQNLNNVKFHIFQPNEKCIHDHCSYRHQVHFHCNSSDGCRFATPHGQAMDQHMIECRSLSSSGGAGSASGGGGSGDPTSATVLDGYQFYDINNDCNIFECTAKRLKPHFHCNNCNQQIQSQQDLEPHSSTCCSSIAGYGDYKVADKPLLSPYSSGKVSAGAAEQKIHDYGSTLNIAVSSNSRLNDEATALSSDKTGEETDMDWNQMKSESSEDERVSVVRAAGTYFPENSDNTKSLAEPSEGLSTNELSSVAGCTRPFCKLKRKVHSHCELCNQGFSDKIKLRIHRLKHSTTRLGQMNLELPNRSAVTASDLSDKELHESQSDTGGAGNCSIEQVDQPQDLSVPVSQSASALQQMMLPQNFADSFSMQNLHLAHLALYQQNPFYYQNFYPFLGSQGLSLSHPDVIKSQFEQASTSTKGTLKPDAMATPFPFVNAAAAAAAAAAAVAGTSNQFDQIKSETFTNLRQKRKADDYASIMELIPAKKPLKAAKQNNFKIFKDEPIPHGYLKFRFNEDCNFPNCGYRNHQSHFHCCRNDCYYSFCDKTRFVQHTARHERLDKLMGDDFKQYRANMRCGYDDCAYNKNVAGQNNKSSHFHCLKCNFICSDTNKVVAHRRQHSKMEYIRMAGFRKVANNEKCTTTTEHDISSGECSYSLKQTHYHCLVCDCSVLSRAQLGSHRHRVQ